MYPVASLSLSPHAMCLAVSSAVQIPLAAPHSPHKSHRGKPLRLRRQGLLPGPSVYILRLAAQIMEDLVVRGNQEAARAERREEGT